MMNPGIAIKHLHSFFLDALTNLYSLEEIESIEALLVEHYLHFTRLSAYLNREKLLAEDEWERIRLALVRLSNGEPVQYIVGEVVFMGLSLRVAPGALIPRPETEEMAAWIIRACATRPHPWKTALDIGTGTGCLALALKHSCPTLHVSAMDVSPTALTIARENAKRYSIDIHFISDNILSPVPGQYADRYDLIISNPPYIPYREKEVTHRNITDYEPEEALFVPDDDPLLFYRAIQLFAATHLHPGGVMFLEFHEAYGMMVQSLFSGNADYFVEQHTDMQGKPRFLSVTCLKH